MYFLASGHKVKEQITKRGSAILNVNLFLYELLKRIRRVEFQKDDFFVQLRNVLQVLTPSL